MFAERLENEKLIELDKYRKKSKKANKNAECSPNKVEDLNLEAIRSLFNDFIDNKLKEEQLQPVINNKNMDINNKKDSCEGCEELKIMKKKMEFQIPTVTIVYIILFSMLLSCSIFSFVLSITGIVTLIHPFISLLSIIGSVGMIVTAVVSIYDWKEFLKR